MRFPSTTESAGTARFQVAAASGRWADAAEFYLPVYTPATTEAFAVYGTVDEGAIAQPVVAPSDVYTQFGGLEISTSSTALQALTDAVLYLTSYPYECSEQIASRVLAVAALRDVLSAFQAEGLPKPEELVEAVTRDIELLQGLQNGDGGWPIWQRGRESWPFYSIHVAHALARARAKGLPRVRGDAGERAELSAQHRVQVPRVVQPGRAQHADLLCPVRARPDGRPGHRSRAPAGTGARRGQAAARRRWAGC